MRDSATAADDDDDPRLYGFFFTWTTSLVGSTWVSGNLPTSGDTSLAHTLAARLTEISHPKRLVFQISPETAAAGSVR